MRKGILGGTFDPVHNGHLAIARTVESELNLDEVVFLPAGMPWLKSHRDITPPEQRLDMLKLALEGELHYAINTMELYRAGNTYTIDTIVAMKWELAEADELYFVIGFDKLPELPMWKDVQRLIELCRLAAVPRPGFTPPGTEWLEEKIPGISQRLTLLDGPHVDISASEVRRRVRQGQEIGGMVPPEVKRYIHEKGLYRE